jgi:hypothetical protein
MNPRRSFLSRFGIAAAAMTLGSAKAIARSGSAKVSAERKEMTASMIGNAHFVAAGIIAVNRAQERGYSIAYTG